MARAYNHTEGVKDFKDVFIIPQYSEITSRKTVSTETKLFDLTLDVPIISANMDTVTNHAVAIEMYKAGGIGALHRFSTIEQNVWEYHAVREQKAECLVSIGVNEESKERAKALFDAGARYFIIDIAHGHSKLMKDMISWLRQEFHDKIFIMGGNVATSQGAQDLVSWGADSVKVGIGPGSVCITKNQTGVTFPQLEAIMECTMGAKSAFFKANKPFSLVADGGLREYGDIAKAIGAGATLVMSGKFFANTSEAPGMREHGGKEYRGMASKEAMRSIKREEDMSTPEGKKVFLSVDEETKVSVVLKDIKGALQSSLSYSNSRNLEEFTKNAIFGYL